MKVVYNLIMEEEKKFSSISSELRHDHRSNDEFEIMLQNLTLEEIISLKLELAARTTNELCKQSSKV